MKLDVEELTVLLAGADQQVSATEEFIKGNLDDETLEATNRYLTALYEVRRAFGILLAAAKEIAAIKNQFEE